MKTGSCLCGAVRFEVEGELPAPDACHCRDCRKFSGHYFVSTDIPRASLRVDGAEHLTWFGTSKKVLRGFCSRCGSSMFWDSPTRDWMGIAMGAFDGPTGTAIAKHIFVAGKGDYYELGDGLPQEQ